MLLIFSRFIEIVNSSLCILYIASALSTVQGCPFLLQPTSFNTSEGSIAIFTTIVCSGSLFWNINNLVYIPGYQSVNVSVYQTTFTNGSVRSDLAIIASSKYNNAEISSTLYTPKPIPSDVAILKVQGIIIKDVIMFNLILYQVY